MGLKQKLLDSVKSHIPQFDETKNSFSIDFDGGGDSFDSFSYFETDVDGWDGMGSDTSFLDDNLLLDIIEESGVEYSWVSATTIGSIVYENQTLTVHTSYQFDDDYDEDDPELNWNSDEKELKE